MKKTTILLLALLAINCSNEEETTVKEIKYSVIYEDPKNFTVVYCDEFNTSLEQIPAPIRQDVGFREGACEERVFITPCRQEQKNSIRWWGETYIISFTENAYSGSGACTN